MISGIIYKYTSPSGKVYIGQTFRERKRKTEHKVRAKSLKEGVFSRAIEKYGFDSFEYEVLERISGDNIAEMQNKLDALEVKYIAEYKSDDENFGYNLTKGGGGCYGFVMPESARKKMSKKHSGKGNPMYGKKLSIETLDKISGKNHHGYGKRLSEETRKRIGESNKGKMRSDDARKHISEGHKRRDKNSYSPYAMHATAIWILPDGTEREMKICHVKRFHKDWIMKEKTINNNLPTWANKQPHRDD